MIFNHFSQTTRNTERENVLSTGRKQYNKLSVFLLHFTTHPHRCRRGADGRQALEDCPCHTYRKAHTVDSPSERGVRHRCEGCCSHPRRPRHRHDVARHVCRRGCDRARRAQCHEGAKKSPLMAGIFLSLGADGLLLTDFYIGDGDGATVVIDAPAVLLDTIDALRVGTYIVDIHGKN